MNIIDKAWWQSKTVWLTIGSIVSFVATWVDFALPFVMDEKWRSKLTALAAFLAALAALSARQAGVESSKEVMDEVKDVKKDVKAVEKKQDA